MSIQTCKAIPIPLVEARTPLPQQHLRSPGPTTVPPAVLEALRGPIVDPYGLAFAAIVKRVTLRLQYFFQTDSPVLTYPASGTGGLESAIVNVFSPGDHVVALITGRFSLLIANLAEAYGLRVTKVEFPWGQAASPAIVKDK